MKLKNVRQRQRVRYELRYRKRGIYWIPHKYRAKWVAYRRHVMWP